MMNASPSISSEPSSQKLPFQNGKGSFLFLVHAPTQGAAVSLVEWDSLLSSATHALS